MESLLKMNVILNSIAEPFVNDKLDIGKIKVEELSIWPEWLVEHPHNDVLAENFWRAA